LYTYKSVTQSASGTSDWVTIDASEQDFNVSVHAEHSGTNTYDIEVTGVAGNDLTTSSDAFKLTSATGLTASTMVAIVGPIIAVRVNITSYSSGSVILHVRQTGKGSDPATGKS
jgi:hypothetical protein